MQVEVCMEACLFQMHGESDNRREKGRATDIEGVSVCDFSVE